MGAVTDARCPPLASTRTTRSTPVTSALATDTMCAGDVSTWMTTAAGAGGLRTARPPRGAPPPPGAGALPPAGAAPPPHATSATKRALKTHRQPVGQDAGKAARPDAPLRLFHLVPRPGARDRSPL